MNFIILYSNKTIFVEISSFSTKLWPFEKYNACLIFYCWNRQISQLSQGEVNHQLRQFSCFHASEHVVFYLWMMNAPAVQIWHYLMVIELSSRYYTGNWPMTTNLVDCSPIYFPAIFFCVRDFFHFPTFVYVKSGTCD